MPLARDCGTVELAVRHHRSEETSLNKSIAAVLALAVVPACAMSQTRLELYGRVDLSVNLHRHSETPSRPARNGTFISSDTSFWGLRGLEDLGGGNRAYFKLESGFNADTGGQSHPTAYWNRETFVGLGHASYGALQLGSQYTPSLLLTAKLDPFRRANTGAIQSLLQQGGAAGIRGYAPQFNNAAQYISPTMGGLVARAMVAASEGAAPGGSPAALSLEYVHDRLFAGVSYDNQRSTGAAAGQPARSHVKNTATGAGATYRFDHFKLHAYYLRNRVEGTTGMTGGMLGISVPIGAGEIQASVHRRSVDDPADSDARLVALQYVHFLSKRTWIYVGAARQENSGSASFTVWPSRLEATAAPAPGANVRAFQLGARHFF
jgi:general bacterial porin, GBP family